MYKIEFEKKSKKQFYKLTRDVQERLTKSIDEKLSINSQAHLIPLGGDKEGLYKFRVGGYRLLCAKNDNDLIVLVVKVKHKKEVYRG